MNVSDNHIEPPGINLRKQAATQQLFLAHKQVVAVDNKTKLYDMAAQTIGADTPTSILEFGVAGGVTIRELARRFRHSQTRLVGFDSFEGLPEPWIGACPRGAFSTNGVPPHTGDTRVSFVKGWFQNTVADWLARNKVSPPVLVNFDADLYGSTLFLLTTLWHHVPDYYFLMDDFGHEDLVALYDFSRSYPVEIRFFGRTPTEHVPPARQVFGHLRRVPFVANGVAQS
jgi:Macrocin-O-methyltransferase (TylF)